MLVIFIPDISNNLSFNSSLLAETFLIGTKVSSLTYEAFNSDFIVSAYIFNTCATLEITSSLFSIFPGTNPNR